MTNDEIRIAVAELCRWKQELVDNRSNPDPESDECYTTMPNYPESLDACALMERDTLHTEQEKRVYVDHLVAEMKPGEFTVMADALRRCTARLKMANKWKDKV